MASNAEGKHTGEFILMEAPGTISRDTVTVTVAAATTLPVGLVLGQISATGKYVPYDNAGAGGADVAAAVLYAELENAAGAPADVTGVVVSRIAEVRKADLEWNGQAAAAQTAGIVDLATRHILARD